MGKEWIIAAESELRCEVKDKETLVLHLLEGNAEVFGVELAADRKYFFRGEENVAVFSWHGCRLLTEGTCQHSAMYTSNETPMTPLVNVHAQLEARRDIALLNGDRGPRVLLAGPQECGKSTAARILAMYAARLDRTPVLADIDVSHSLVSSVSGCLGAISVDKRCLNMEVKVSAAILSHITAFVVLLSVPFVYS
jgi:polyribonucleotide 5'-hydroxyl-kinase